MSTLQPEAQPQCVACTHLDREEIHDPTCDAFPDGIPGEILTNQVDHHVPYPGDNGVQFDLIPLDVIDGDAR